MLVRPHLEYACSVWDPYLKRDIDKLERVQSFALKICLKQWSPNTGYRELLERAELQSLASRRKYFKQCQLFSMLNGVFFCVSPPTTRIQRNLYIAEPLYSGHPWDTTKWLLYRGGLLIEMYVRAQEASHVRKSTWPWRVRYLAKAPATNGPRMSEATMCTKPCGLQPLVKR